LSGIILIDFIDMKQPEHRDQVVNALELALKRDRIKTKVHGISHLGLVEVTRQRTRAPLSEVMEEECTACGGRGRIGKQVNR
jgi:ribonuclease G